MEDAEGMCHSVPGGNTESPGYKCKENAVYRWVFTLKKEKVDMCQLCHTLREYCKEWQFQEEKGSEGYEHYQGCFSLKIKHRFSEVKNMLGYHDIHLEHAKNWYASLKYCSKGDSRVAGPWNQDTIFIKTITVLKEWQKRLEAECLTEPDDRHIHWITNLNGGIGKTVFAKYMAVKHGATVLTNGKSADLSYVLPDNPKIVIFNLARSAEDHFNYQALENIKDGMMLSPKYESRMKLFNAPHVIVFANWQPDMDSLSRDRWVCELL